MNFYELQVIFYWLKLSYLICKNYCWFNKHHGRFEIKKFIYFLIK